MPTNRVGCCCVVGGGGEPDAPCEPCPLPTEDLAYSVVYTGTYSEFGICGPSGSNSASGTLTYHGIHGTPAYHVWAVKFPHGHWGILANCDEESEEEIICETNDITFYGVVMICPVEGGTTRVSPYYCGFDEFSTIGDFDPYMIDYTLTGTSCDPLAVEWTWGIPAVGNDFSFVVTVSELP